MDLRGWDQRYRSLDAAEKRDPAPFVVEAASGLQPGRMLDLACGAGRHALWFAERGWSVTAVDGSAAALHHLRRSADAQGVRLDGRVADLEKHEFAIEPAAWDLIVIWLYLQCDLFDRAKAGLKPGGILIASVLMVKPGEEATGHRSRPGELKSYFRDWEILNYAERNSTEPGHEHSVAEIAARRRAESL